MTPQQIIIQALASAVTFIEYILKVKEALQQDTEWTVEENTAWNDSLNRLNDMPHWKPRND